jgi:hypothetical protein
MRTARASARLLVVFLITLLPVQVAALPIATRHDPRTPPPAPVAAPTVRLPSVRLVDDAQPPPDPCADYDALEAGHGEPTRQDTFNHEDARGYARWRMACVYHLGGGDPAHPVRGTYACLDDIWTEESGWYHLADGPNGPAGNTWGIPQAYPGDKMAADGPDWKTNPRVQVRWGLGYLWGTYWSKGRSTPHGCHAGY